MANLYWVGGTDNWDNTALLKWSTSSGGLGGAAVPTNADSVFFDANSGGGTITIVTAVAVCLNLDFTGFTGTITGNAGLQIKGSLTLSAAMTNSIASGGGSGITFNGSSGTGIITSNGKAFNSNCSITINGSGATYQLADDLAVGNGFDITAGTFDANGHNVSAKSFNTAHVGTRVITMGSGIWTFTSTGGWDAHTTTNLTLNANTSTIKFTDTSGTNINFQGGGKTYNNLYLNRGSGTGSVTITGANTFNDIRDDGTGTHTIVFPASTTTTTTTFTVSGTSGHLISLNSSSSGTTWTISASSGTISRDYLSIKDSTATGGASWYAGANSTSVSNNSGWTFTAPPVGSNAGNFLMFM